MAYLRCTQCGSKALVAASQCPKCAHPFNLLDARGERAKLKRCRSCGIMHRADTHCHWCGEVKSRFALPTISAAALRQVAALAMIATAAGGVWRFGPAVRDAVVAAAAESTGENTAAAPTARVAANDAPAAMSSSPTGASAAVASTAQDTAAMDDAAGAIGDAAESDPGTAYASAGEREIQWVPAVARTWVNVRSDASRGGEVVGVIKPASRAMLGTDRAGWRQVRSPDVSGWVDPRLFEPDSLRPRGE